MDMPPSLDALQGHAERVRAALQAMPLAERGAGLRAFPQGACGDAVLLLGAYLADQGWRDFECVRGGSGSRLDDSWEAHAWLQRGELVLDIAADRFADAPAAVIVASPSAWHLARFRVEQRPEPADFRRYTGPDLLHVVFARMLQYLPARA